MSSEKFISSFPNLSNCCNKDLETFILSLGKCVVNTLILAKNLTIIITNKRKLFIEIKKEEISDKDYKHTRKVWKRLNLKDLGEYLAEYNIIDVLLRSEAVEKFKKNIHKKYDLNPLGFVTLSSLSWASSLKNTKIKLELISDIDMLHVYENGIRGEITRAVDHYAESNYKCIFDYDEAKEKSYLPNLTLTINMDWLSFRRTNCLRWI